MAGAEVVVDVANPPSFEDKAVLEFFETAGRLLLAAEAAAAVGHRVALSAVETERFLASGFSVLRVRGPRRERGHGRANRPGVLRDVAARRAGRRRRRAGRDRRRGTGERHGRAGGFRGASRLDDLISRMPSANCDARQVTADARALDFKIEPYDRSLTSGANPRRGTTRFEDRLGRLAGARRIRMGRVVDWQQWKSPAFSSVFRCRIRVGRRARGLQRRISS